MKQITSLFTDKPIQIIEKEDFFKKGFRYIFLFGAAVVAIFAIYSVISGSVDFFGFFSNLTAWQIIRSIILFFLCLIVSILAFALIVGILWKRAETIISEKSNIVDLVPRVLKTLGEVLAVFPLTIAFIALFTGITAGVPFIPILSLSSFFSAFSMFELSVAMSGIGVSGFTGYFEQLFVIGLIPFVSGIIFSFLNIAIFYLLAELYKIVVAFLRRE